MARALLVPSAPMMPWLRARLALLNQVVAAGNLTTGAPDASMRCIDWSGASAALFQKTRGWIPLPNPLPAIPMGDPCGRPSRFLPFFQDEPLFQNETFILVARDLIALATIGRAATGI